MKFSIKRVFYSIVIIFILVFLIGGFLILNRTVNPLTDEEKSRVLTRLSGGQISLTQKAKVKGLAQFKGKYYKFSYPLAGVIYNQDKSGSDVLENFSFDIKDFPKIYFYSEVKKAASGISNISDYSGVSFRLSNPDTYKKKAVIADNIDGFIFEKTNLQDSETYEQIAYFLVNGKIYSFSVQSVDQQAQVDLLNNILATVKFEN